MNKSIIKISKALCFAAIFGFSIWICVLIGNMINPVMTICEMKDCDKIHLMIAMACLGLCILIQCCIILCCHPSD